MTPFNLLKAEGKQVSLLDDSKIRNGSYYKCHMSVLTATFVSDSGCLTF